MTRNQNQNSKYTEKCRLQIKRKIQFNAWPVGVAKSSS